jgi:glycosyltransferase involved in cell wall biosynthesis
MRFLMVCMQFPTEPGQSYLTTELADALIAGGHAVEVLHLDWSRSPSAPVEEFTTANSVRVVRCSPALVGGLGRTIRDASKFILSGRRAARVAKAHFDLASFDAAITWMPAVAIAPLVKMIERAGIRHRLLFIWDFFPDHHHEIGRIPGGLPLRIARAWEQKLLSRFTAIICTLPGNADYLRRRFRLRPDQRVLVNPVWGDIGPAPAVDRAEIRARHSLPADAPIAVFGGQLVEGRGFEQMLAAADAALMAGSDLLFLFVGEGRLARQIRYRAERQANVIYRSPLTRAEYLELLGACDVGMVATVPGVTSFSIPSKTVDYLRAGLPIIAAVEHGNDFVGVLDQHGVGRAVAFGEPERFFLEAEILARHGRISAAAARCLEQVFDVRLAAATVVEAASGQPSGGGAASPPQGPTPLSHKRRRSRSAGRAPRRSRPRQPSARP